MYLFDTSAITELRKAKHKNKKFKADPGLIEWVKHVDHSTIYVSSIAFMEIEIAILSMEKKNKHQGKLLRNWFDELVKPAFDGRVIAFDQAIALKCAALRVPDPHRMRNAIVAATALVHKMILVTKNEKDFIYTGVDIVSPWITTMPRQTLESISAPTMVSRNTSDSELY